MSRFLPLLLATLGLVCLGCIDDKKATTGVSANSNASTRTSSDRAVARQPKVRFLDFTATWCGPCREQKPILHALMKEFPAVDFSEIDIDENEDLTDMYEVRVVPTLIVLVDGKEVKRFTGVQERDTLAPVLTKALADAANKRS